MKQIAAVVMIAMPAPAVIVSAGTRFHEVETGMQALRAGAVTMLLKPSGPESPEFDRAAKELIDTVKTMADVKVVRHLRRPMHPGPAAPPIREPQARTRQVCLQRSVEPVP